MMIGFSLAVLIFWGWILIWLLQQVKTSNITLRGMEEKITELEVKRKMASEIQTLLQDRAKDLARISSFSVDKERPVVFIEALEEAAKKSGNRVTIGFSEGKSKNKDIFFQLVVEGSESSVLKYLKLLEFLPYKIKVEEVALQRLTTGVPALLSLPKEANVPLSHRLDISIKVETL